MVDSIVIIGTGIAGYSVAREFRKLNTSQGIVFVTADDGSFYSKPMLSNALSKDKTPATLVTANADKVALDLEAQVQRNTTVVRIDSVEKKLITTAGDAIYYAKLVLAMGAQATPYKVSGTAQNKIYYVNSLQEYTEFYQAIRNKKHIVIIGTGLVGCEFANDLATKGYQVDIIGHAAYPLNNILPEQLGQYLQRCLEKETVNFHMQTEVTSLDGNEEDMTATLKSGEKLHADVVLSAIGLTANIGIAEQAGININRGIVVDAFLHTNQADIYAIGDCIEIDGRHLPFISPIMTGARALAKTLAGEATKVDYPIMPVQVKTPACPVITCPPEKNLAGRWHIEESEEAIEAKFLDKYGVLAGFCLMGSATSQRQQYIKALQETTL